MKPNPIVSLYQSRKSIVGLGALALVGLVYFFGAGGWPEKSTAMGSISAIAIAIINAIGKEDVSKNELEAATVTADAAAGAAKGKE